MTIVTGDLTLPNQLTVQGWLAQFFSINPADYGLDTYIGQGSFEIESPPADIFGFPEGKVTLTQSRINEAITEVKDRKITSITIEDGSGKSMQIQLINPTSAQTYFETLDNGSGAQAFYESLQPNISGFYSQTGSDGDDFMQGFASNDRFFGEGGNDTFLADGGDDEIDGGIGYDTFTADSYRNQLLLLENNEISVTDRSPGGNGTDTLKNIEAIEFEEGPFDGPFDLQAYSGLTGLSVDELKSFIELYIAYFNRAPDAVGLYFWGTAYANGTSLEEMAALFIDQDETRATYSADLSNEDFATEVYGNVLGRIADQLGFDFWVGALDSGAVSADQFILAVLEGAKAAPPSNATAEFLSQQQADRAYLSDKADIGAYFSVIKGMSDVENARAAMSGFDGSAASLNNAVSAIDGYYQDAISPTGGEFVMQFVGILDDPFGQ